MKRKGLIGLGIVAIIMIPIGLNCILGMYTPALFENIEIIGEGRDWLSFYGSYIGGVITATISFIILYQTIAYNRNEAEINRQEEKLRRLQDDLGDIVGELNFSKIGNVALVINDHERCKEENLKLDTFHQELTLHFNSFNLLYENETDSVVVDFMRLYKICVTKLFDEITAMTRLISRLPPFISQGKISMIKEILRYYERGNPQSVTSFIERENFKEQIASIKDRKDIVNEINFLVHELGQQKAQFVNPVYEAAQRWIASERAKIDQLKR